MGDYQYHPEVQKFHSACYENGFVQSFDWGLFSNEAKRYMSDPALISSADLMTCVKLITTHLRAERFTDGHLLEVLKSGHMTAILQRLEELGDMQASKDPVLINRKDLKGSRLRCLMLTTMPREVVAATLNELVSPFATVSPDDHWVPRGFLSAEEARLDEHVPGTYEFVPKVIREQLKVWWLKKTNRANTPNWDLISTCKIKDGREGLVLIEAKAHEGELKIDGKKQGDSDNDEQIGLAIDEANSALEKITPGWHLSRDRHYQLSNRFAWAWKLATLGKPTVLIYLGFLRAWEMRDHCQKPFESAAEWDRFLHTSAVGIVPDGAFGTPLNTTGVPMWACVRSLDLNWVVRN